MSGLHLVRCAKDPAASAEKREKNLNSALKNRDFNLIGLSLGSRVYSRDDTRRLRKGQAAAGSAG